MNNHVNCQRRTAVVDDALQGTDRMWMRPWRYTGFRARHDDHSMRWRTIACVEIRAGIARQTASQV